MAQELAHPVDIHVVGQEHRREGMPGAVEGEMFRDLGARCPLLENPVDLNIAEKVEDFGTILLSRS